MFALPVLGAILIFTALTLPGYLKRRRIEALMKKRKVEMERIRSATEFAQKEQERITREHELDWAESMRERDEAIRKFEEGQARIRERMARQHRLKQEKAANEFANFQKKLKEDREKLIKERENLNEKGN